VPGSPNPVWQQSEQLYLKRSQGSKTLRFLGLWGLKVPAPASFYLVTIINHLLLLLFMLNKKVFQELREGIEKFDAMREELIAQSRLILKASKAAIYAAHRGDMKEAQELLTGTKKTLVQIDGLLKKDAHLAATGAYGDALEEYAEAACYIHYLATKQIATPKQIGVDADVYLPALGDLVGELVRKAVNSVIAGDSTTALEIKDTVSELYAELMLFDWRNTPARKKFDSIKYGLEKLEDLALKIKLK